MRVRLVNSMIDYRAELLVLSERAQSDLDVTEMLELSSALYGLARLIDMKAVLQKARELSPRYEAVVH